MVVAIFLFSIIVIQPFIADKEVSFENVRFGCWSGVSERIEQRITDLETWEDLWAEMESGQSHVAPAPTINFSTSVLFVAFQGECGSSGHWTTITRIVLTTTGYVVFVDEIHPGPGCIVLCVMTQPHHIVVVDLTQNLPVQFVYNITVYDCG